MRIKRLSIFLGLALLLSVISTGIMASGGLTGLTRLAGLASATAQPQHPVVDPQPFPDAYKITDGRPANISVPGSTEGLTHPCGGMSPAPPHSGVSPLAIAWVPSNCGNYGDIAVWQAGGHSYVAQSGWTGKMYHIWNVDNPYTPIILKTQAFPSGGNTSKAIFHFHQFGHEYLATAMSGSISSGCGYFIDNVDDPANPVRISRTVGPNGGTDWCTVHETFVSTNANGDADYAWLTMSGENGSGLKVVALTLPDLSQPSPVILETGRYQRPDSSPGASGGIFNHDSNVVGDRVYLGHWAGGAVIMDKETLAHNIQPTEISSNTIRPSNFWVHHLVPTTDNKFLVIEDEFINNPSLEKIKLYNMENIAAPFYAGGITGGDTQSNNSQAHNQIIKNLGPHHDLLLSAFYLAGYRLYDLDTAGANPVITQVGSHQLRANGGPNFGGVWGVDQLPCTVRGVATTCIYSSDMTYGLVVDALGVNPALDPYLPDPAVVTSPTANQQIDTCSFTIQGTAAEDYWSGLASVEVSVDGGTTWMAATGTTTWSYQWNINGSGPFTIKVRATDNAGNVRPTADLNVSVNANCAPFEATPTPTTAPSNTPVLTNTPVPTDTPMPTNTSVSATSTAVPPTATPVACDIEFIDVPVGSTFYPMIKCLACNGVFNGYPDGTFRPNNSVTRGQIAKIVSNAAGFIDPVSGQTFEDVLPGSTFYTYTERLASRSIMSGYPCGSPGEPCGSGNLPYFRPNGNATRGQIAKIVSNAAGFTDPASGQTFEDVLPGSTFYDFIERLASRGIMGGYPCGSPGEPCGPGNLPYFRPNTNASRGQTAKIVSGTFFPECTPNR
ncbi:MAG: S-layer homology domain-containing protein [Chloroflexota bacterium]